MMRRLRLSLPPAETGLRLAVIAVNTLLVIALAYTLAGLTLAMLAGDSPTLTGQVPPSGSVIPGSAMPQPSADVAAISAWHLFGKAEAKRAAPPPPVAIPTTPLNLRLVGTFFAERGSDQALALIADGNNLERGYRIGEALPGSARLERIERDQVIVSRGGREEALKLPKLDDPNRPMLAPAPPISAIPLEPASEPTSASEPQVINASVIAERLRGEVANRPQALEDIAFASPYVQNGQFVGFRLRPGRDRQLFQQLGLTGGDVLTEINGMRLSSPAQGLAILQELMSASRIDVRVLRNGAEVPLTFTLDGS
ncbi:MAG TPA: type II secretion system protein GspC [Gammaproteobacteria bacterium]|nr:type II secretion system protein GspC [Gammaproteobacteria bacterium]